MNAHRPTCCLLILCLLGATPLGCGEDITEPSADARSAGPDADQSAGDAGSSAPDAEVPVDLEQLVLDFEAGIVSRDQFRAAVARVEDPGWPTSLSQDFAATTLLAARAEPYIVETDIAVLEGAILVIEEGTSLRLGPAVSMTVQGRLYAVGSQDSPIHIHGEPAQDYQQLRLESGPNQLVWTEFDRGIENLVVAHPADTTTLVEQCRFDSWGLRALYQDASQLRVAHSRFGMQTAENEITGETFGSYNAGLTVLEDNDFGRMRGRGDILDLQLCQAGSWSVIAHNRFFGGEDDAIDLDRCNALVVGNTIRDFKPVDPGAMNAPSNGGGITGDSGSMPVIINNLIDGCFHAIGFKNGARPIIINNTITNNNIGVTLYNTAPGVIMPTGVMINNVLWNNLGWLDGGQDNDIVLNGKWWWSYNQVDDIQGNLEAMYNTLGSSPSSYPGDGNTSDDPLLDDIDGVPVPAANSPAIDSGASTISFTSLPIEQIPMEDVLQYLSRDYQGQPRERVGDTFPTIDRGAVERQ